MKTKKFTKLHRVLHWLIAFGLLFILLTIFLRQNWINKYKVAEIITQQLSEIQVDIANNQAVVIAKKIREPMWQWHLYVGYFIAALYFVRILYIFIKGSFFNNPFSSETVGKEKVQAFIYILFYTFLGVSLITGGLVVFGAEENRHSIEAVHKLSNLWLMPFIILHLGGTVVGELTSQKGIVSKMINGSD